MGKTLDFVFFGLIFTVFVIILTDAAVVSRSRGEDLLECPYSDHVGYCIWVDGANCRGDEECAGSKKCCPFGCGRECKELVPASVNIQRRIDKLYKGLEYLRTTKSPPGKTTGALQE